MRQGRVRWNARGGTNLHTTGRITVGDPKSPVTIEVEVRATRNLDTPGGAAGTEPSRLDLQQPDVAAGQRNWRANITISNRLQGDDVALVVGRELDEAIDIARRGNLGIVASEQRAVAFKPGARLPANKLQTTAADRAALRQLGSMRADLTYRQQVLATAEVNRTATAAMRNALEHQEARVQRLMRSMGLDDPSRFADRIHLLREMGIADDELRSLQVFVERRAFAARPHPGLTATQPVMTNDLIEHMVHPRRSSEGEFRRAGIDGGHLTENLKQFVAANPQFAIVEVRARSVGGTTYREFRQFRWKNAEAPPPVGDPRRPGGTLFATAEQAKWDVAGVPKTTTDELQPFLRDAVAAWESWRSANFVPGATPSGAATRPDVTFRTNRSTAGMVYEGGFQFTAGPPRNGSSTRSIHSCDCGASSPRGSRPPHPARRRS